MDILVNVLVTAALIIIGVLLFELIIFFHEGGHFVSAKLSGVKVNEFALGMGPKIFSFTKGETRYSLRLFPIGGFCAMEGEDEDSDNPRAFNNAKLYKRLVIIIAGAVMNIILGLVFMALLLIPGDYFSNSTIEAFPPKSYSANSGLEVGDEIVSIGGYYINNSFDLSYSFAKLKVQNVSGDSLQIYKQDCSNALADEYYRMFPESKPDEQRQLYFTLTESCNKIYSAKSSDEADKALLEGYEALFSYFPNEEYVIRDIEVKETRPRFRTDIVVRRNGEVITLKDVDFMTYTTDDDSTPMMAIDFYTGANEKNFFSVIGETFSRTGSVVRMVFDTLVGLVSGQFGFGDVSGPIGAASATVQVAQQGLESSFGDAVLNILYVMMIITINLGIVNMLPFPALDGGRFLFLIIEGIFKKPIPRKVESIINAVGLGILLVFMLIISIKDVWKLFV